MLLLNLFLISKGQHREKSRQHSWSLKKHLDELVGQADKIRQTTGSIPSTQKLLLHRLMVLLYKTGNIL
jgi:hypothetical protein